MRKFTWMSAFLTGFVTEIGLKVLNKRRGPAMRRIIPIMPTTPIRNFMNFGIGFPTG